MAPAMGDVTRFLTNKACGVEQTAVLRRARSSRRTRTPSCLILYKSLTVLTTVGLEECARVRRVVGLTRRQGGWGCSPGRRKQRETGTRAAQRGRDPKGAKRPQRDGRQDRSTGSNHPSIRARRSILSRRFGWCPRKGGSSENLITIS
jgi:hypothetical protein